MQALPPLLERIRTMQSCDEAYLDLPKRAKAAYDYASLYPWAGKICGKLMLLVGSSDPFCYSNTLEMVHYLIEAGVDHELVVLPEAYHTFLGRNEDYFIHKLVAHFEVHLKARAKAKGGREETVRLRALSN